MEDSDAEFRTVLVKVTDRISENELNKLRFIFSDKIRRDHGNGCAIDLFQQLLDRGIIDRQNLSKLISALDDIGCCPAAQLLRDYQLSTLTIVIHRTILEEVSDDNTFDKFSTSDITSSLDGRSSNPQQDFLLNNNENTTSKLTRYGKTNKKTRIIKYFIFLIIFLIYIITLVKAIECLISKLSGEQMPLSINNKSIDNQDKTTSKLLVYVSPIDDLTVIKFGNVFGSDGDHSTDDSKHFPLTIWHYISSISITSSDWMSSMECIYSFSSPLRIEPPTPGFTRGSQGIYNNIYRNETFNVTEKSPNERIDRVSLVINAGRDDSKILPRYIVGMQFHTTFNRTSPFYGSQKGQLYTEEYSGFVLGYVRGAAHKYIDRLQFIWYKL